jgi:hypothetical protein
LRLRNSGGEKSIDIIHELIGFGDCIKPGLYKILSRFSKAVNYVRNGRLVSFVTEDVGNGPVNVVLKKLNFQNINRVRITDKDIEIGKSRIELIEHKKYDSSVTFKLINIPGFIKNLIYFKKIVLDTSSTKSFAFLLDEKRKEEFKSAFEKALINRVMKGWQEIIKHNYEKGTRLIKGTGYGFTPGGDDFISGFLSGLYFSKVAFGKDVSKIQELIYKESKTENIVSNNFIYCSFKGYFFEKTKNLIISLVEGGEKEIMTDALKVLSPGETSGADFAAGLIGSLQDFYR